MMIKRMSNDNAILNAFKNFDKSGSCSSSSLPLARLADRFFYAYRDGKISPAELKEAMKQMGQTMSDKDINAMIAAVDKDGDGHVDYKEFVKMMGNQK